MWLLAFGVKPHVDNIVLVGRVRPDFARSCLIRGKYILTEIICAHFHCRHNAHFIINPTAHDSNKVPIHKQISDELLFQLQIAGENVAILVTYDISVGVWSLDGGFFFFFKEIFYILYFFK
jgi:hypothetical protein